MPDNAQAHHIDDEAELYALGALDADERAAVEAHIASCEMCLQRVRDAEETAFALSAQFGSTTPPAELDTRIAGAFSRNMPARPWLAIAAAFIIGLLPSIPLTYDRVHHDRLLRMHDQAVTAMVTSHFAHAQFTPVGGATLPPSKVIFARDGSWLYVVIAGAHRYTVEGVEPEGTKALGETSPTSSTSELFLERPPHVRSVMLVDNGTPIGSANVVVTNSR